MDSIIPILLGLSALPAPAYAAEAQPAQPSAILAQPPAGSAVKRTGEAPKLKLDVCPAGARFYVRWEF